MAPSSDNPSTVPTCLADGRYHVIRPLSEGSRKRVYLAHDTQLDRDVAVALIRLEGLDEAGRTRARREAQAMARLGDHPHIVTVHDIGEEAGQPYLVTQYVAGGDLAERLREAADHCLPVPEVLRIAEQLCQALGHAHAQGIIHRDVKPANIWLTADGTVKLGDFGLALRQDRSRASLEGMLVGTVAYLPPEQALGRRPEPQSDLYALGAVLYELLTGRPPFSGDDAIAIVSQHLHTPPVAPSWHNAEVTAPLDALILHLLAKAPADRPASAAVVQSALAAVHPVPPPVDTTARGPSPAAVLRPPPNPITGLATGVFVGRTAELAALRELVEDALGGTGHAVLVAGEPGIGKTRFAQEIATYAQLRGLRIRLGRCYEGGGAPAYWPWIQILRTHLTESAPQDVLADLGPGVADVAQVVSAVRTLVPDIAPPPKLEPEQARFRFFDSVTTFLQNAAARQPLLLVVDDLHWADAASLRLLQFVARELGRMPLVLLATYREEDVAPAGVLFETLATLSREPTTRRLSLAGLSEAEVGEYIARTTARAAAPALTSRVSRETDGNPFFVGEVVRLLVAEGRTDAAESGTTPLGLPPGVREVIGRRLVRLSAECRRVLTTAALVGREFELDILDRCDELAGERLLEVLDEAIDARVIAEVPRSAGHYSFAHALIRETLNQELAVGRRIRLHHQIGEALEAVAGPNADRYLDRLAHHFFETGPTGDVAKAADYLARAAERAMRLLAYEEACSHYAHALERLERTQPRDHQLHCEVLLALGEARWNAGDTTGSGEAFRGAAAAARRLQAPELLARAVLGVGGQQSGYRLVDIDEQLPSLLEEALQALGPADSVTRAQVMARLSEVLAFSKARERSGILAQQALAMARRVRNQKVLADVLRHTRWSSSAAEDPEKRLAAAMEIVQLANDSGDTPGVLAGHFWRVHALLEIGDIAGADQGLRDYARLAGGLRIPAYLATIHLMNGQRALMDGRFKEAETLAQQALTAGYRMGEKGLITGALLQLFILRREQGRHPELEAEMMADAKHWRQALAIIWLDTGRDAEAHRELEQEAAGDFAEMPRDLVWAAALTYLSEVCAALHDRSHAAALYLQLEPFRKLCVAAPQAGSFGSAARPLGMLARTMGRWEDAVRHFEDALAMNSRIESPPWLAHTQHEYADMLLKRDAPGDRERAVQLLAEATDTAERLGMKALLDKALPLKLRAQGIASADVRSSIDTVEQAVRAEQPDLRSRAAPDGTVTLLFSDIEGFTALTARLGDRAAHDILTAHNTILREQVTRQGGYEVKALGDGFMVAFAGTQPALLCAIAVQRALAGYVADHPEEPIRVRIGLHTGEVIKEGTDFFGTTVNLAARIADQARGGEILVSSLVKELAEGVAEVHFGRGRKVPLKGLPSARVLFPVRWSGDAAEVADGESEYVFRRDGEYWTVVFDGEACRLKDAKGLHQIARLLAHPGQEFHVLDLMSDVPAAPGAPVAAHAAPGAALDEHAKRAYRERLAELREALDEAERFNDAGRAQRARAEMESLTQQLAAAVGLGGRDRPAGAAAERARSTVGRRIRWAIRKIAAANPALGRHLTTSVKTGYFCSYSPDPAQPIAWDL